MPKKKKKRSDISSHGHFLAMMIVFVGVSMFAIFSFWSSTNDYIKYMYSSTLHSDVPASDVVIEEIEEAYEIFSDVDSKHFNAEAIEILYNEGIINGHKDGSFKPENTINRAELLVILTNVVDADFGGQTLGNCCIDVEEQWFSAFVCYAKERNWMKGYEDGSCGPERPVSKAEALKIVFEALDYPVCEIVENPPYNDVELDAWYAPYACSGKDNGIIVKSGWFNADSELTRAEVSQIVYNVMVANGMFGDESEIIFLK